MYKNRFKFTNKNHQKKCYLMKKIIRIAPLLLITILQSSTIFSSYEATCVLPYQWDKKGTLWVLIGQEKRHEGYVWFDFCGKKDRKDEKPLNTALREAAEETAGQLKFHRIKEKPFFYRDGSTIHYVLHAYYINPDYIKAAAQRLQSKGRGRNIEKTAWKWIKAKDLLQERTNLKLYRLFNKKLQAKPIRDYLEQLIAEKPMILLKRASQKSQKIYKRSKRSNFCL